MAAANTDKFMKVGIQSATTLDANYTINDATVTVASTSGWPTDTGITFAMDVIDSSGVQVAGTYNEFVGTVSTATSITNVDYADGTGDRNYTAGATTRVYIPVSKTRENRLVEGMIAQHKQDGTHEDITADSLAVSGTATLTGTTTLVSWDGWQPVSDSWSYASGATTNVGTITVPTDATTRYQAGMKLKFTQTTVKYAIITKVEATTLTIYMGTDYTIANAAISAISVSNVKAPFGFPQNPAKWTVTTSSANDRTANTTSFTSGTDTLVVPIGEWFVSFKGYISLVSGGTSGKSALWTLSTDASTETDSEFTVGQTSNTVSMTVGGAFYARKTASLAASTTYTVMGRVTSTTNSPTNTLSGSGVTPTVIKAVCAYL